ncbi:alpha-amylase domain-containing protein [Pseudozobellia sp. WGM2]|uniref:alpha-amylase domain-containing protein n=1 Tax=Pseudozobellia sp. WGM2 TaxID=2787625 RepID=UPI001ADFFB40|nr:alpha-amylase domain-containing protein [Pseudozobellia sp. WGM2]
MKIYNYIKLGLGSLIMLITACTNDDFTPLRVSQSNNAEDSPTGSAQARANVLLPGSGVMMQAFYWDVTEGGIWWNNIESKLDSWAANGVDAIWIPPISKGQSGGFSMGYDPADYFDFGDFQQHGTVETRFGNREELEKMIGTAHENDIAVIADIVINHNSGGALEYNEFRQIETYTLFEPASGLFNRTWLNYLPNAENLEDEGRFGGFPDLDLKNDYVIDWLWRSEESVASFYMNTLNIDGWRFDYVKGFSPDVVKQWIGSVGGYSVGENFDGNVTDVVGPWVEASGANAFDFPNFFNMRNAFLNGNLNELTKPSLLSTMPEKAVTFVGNHDTESRDGSNEFPNEFETHAYAYIMSAPGYPCVFYSHYEDSGDEQKEKINQLIQIRSQLAAGDWSVNFVNNQEFIATRGGDDEKPGLVLYINLTDQEVSREVQTHWNSSNIKDYTEKYNLFQNSDANGLVVLKAPAMGYTIWAATDDEQVAFSDILYVPGGHQGWDPNTAPKLDAFETPNLAGTYKGHVSLTGEINEFKFTDAPNWNNGIYGDEGEGTAGVLAAPGNSVVLPGPLDYEINVDLVNNTWSANTWAIIGSGTPNGWDDPDTDMNYDFDRNVWTITTNLTDGELKFRANNGWDINLGGTGAEGDLSDGGDNIAVTAGSYQIDLDVTNKTFNLGNWGIIGSATPNGGDDPDTDMGYDMTNEVWTITIDLVPGEMKFRFNDAWNVNLGDAGAGSSLEQDGDNIMITTAGNYTITLDVVRNIYSINSN